MEKQVPLNIRIPQQLDDRLRGEIERTGSYRSEIVRRAIDEYLERKELTHKKDQK